jgi:hypothetical protein
MPKVLGSYIGAENLAYVVAIEEEGWVADVMKRYSPEWSVSVKACADPTWFSATITKMNSGLQVSDECLVCICVFFHLTPSTNCLIVLWESRNVQLSNNRTFGRKSRLNLFQTL